MEPRFKLRYICLQLPCPQPLVHRPPVERLFGPVLFRSHSDLSVSHATSPIQTLNQVSWPSQDDLCTYAYWYKNFTIVNINRWAVFLYCQRLRPSDIIEYLLYTHCELSMGCTTATHWHFTGFLYWTQNRNCSSWSSGDLERLNIVFTLIPPIHWLDVKQHFSDTIQICV